MVQTGRVRWSTWKRIWKAHNSRRQRKPRRLKPTEGFLSNLDAYPKQVILYYSGAEHADFKRLVGELAEKFGAKNQSDTVLTSLRALMSVPRRFPAVS